MRLNPFKRSARPVRHVSFPQTDPATPSPNQPTSPLANLSADGPPLHPLHDALSQSAPGANVTILDADPSTLKPIDGFPGQYTNGQGKGAGDMSTDGSMEYAVYDQNGKFLGWDMDVAQNGKETRYGYSYGTQVPQGINLTAPLPVPQPIAGSVTPLATVGASSGLPAVGQPLSEHGAGQGNAQPDKLILTDAVKGPAPAWQSADLSSTLPMDKVGAQLQSHGMGLEERDSRDGKSEIVQMSDGTYDSVDKTTGAVSGAGTWGDGHGGGVARNGVGNPAPTTSASSVPAAPSPGSVTHIAVTSAPSAPVIPLPPTSPDGPVRGAASAAPATAPASDWTTANAYPDLKGISAEPQMASHGDVLAERANADGTKEILQMSDGTYQTVNKADNNYAGSAGTWGDGHGGGVAQNGIGNPAIPTSASTMPAPPASSHPMIPAPVAANNPPITHIAEPMPVSPPVPSSPPPNGEEIGDLPLHGGGSAIGAHDVAHKITLPPKSPHDLPLGGGLAALDPSSGTRYLGRH